MEPGIAPSILAADFSRLGEQIKEAEAGGAELIHIDVMDGHFVPNITMGPAVVEACRRVTELPLDVHLMISDPERHLQNFALAGADIITVHSEATPHAHRALEAIREADVQAGLAVNPLTPVTALREALPYIDLALLMTVNPGFGGQRFIPGSIARLRRLREWRDQINPDCRIEVDGGIGPATAQKVVDAGADLLVAGSAVFGGQGSVAENMAALREATAAR